MYNIRIHNVINYLISFLYRIGIWHRGDKPTVRELGMKWFYSIHYFLFFVSLLCGVISSFHNYDTINIINQSMFTATVTVIVGVLNFKLRVLIWKQEEIMSLLNLISVYTIRNDESFLFCNSKLEKFITFAVAFLTVTIVASCFAGFVVPFFGTEKTMFFIIAFPLDWKHDNFAFLLANVFISTEAFLTTTTIIFSIIIWYLMMQCSFRYEGITGDVRIMGRSTEQKNEKTSEKELRNIFLKDLKDAIVAHGNLRGLIDKFESLSSNLFFIQFCTSGVCICASTYCLAFDTSDNMVERIIVMYMFSYNIAELFMITQFGNEIMLSSSRLSYSLFESDWYEQPQSTKKCIIIFNEYLNQPHVLLIGKLFPLNLETFNRIVRSAYSMFNILKSIQQ